ncbi:MAG: transglutaminase family protein [Phycisphaerae bacterium]
MADYPTLWQLLALAEPQFEAVDLVIANLAVARGIDGCGALDIARYVRAVDEWTGFFRRQLPGLEQMFRATPEKWKGDIRFFRIGMLQGFLGHKIGIRYIESHKHAKEVWYNDPGQLFLHGLIDTRQGTCGNMAALHVAMCRRLGWPVSLACADGHLLSRFDDGEVVYNIEATADHPGAFASDPDDYYIERFRLPQRAIACGSDLRRLTMRQMIGVFLQLRARYHHDIGRSSLCDSDLCLTRVLFPNYRRAYIASMAPMIQVGRRLFNNDELGHPSSLAESLGLGTPSPLL